MMLNVILFTITCGLPLPCMTQSFTMYNILNSYDDVVITEHPDYFTGLFVGINVCAYVYTHILSRLTNHARYTALMIMLNISGLILETGIVLMYFYSDSMPIAGVAFLTGSFTPIIIFVAMDTSIVYLSNCTDSSPQAITTMPTVLLAIYNSYGIPISICRMYSSNIDLYLYVAFIATLIEVVSLNIFLTLGYRNAPKVTDTSKSMTFGQTMQYLVTSKISYWVIPTMVFLIIGLTIYFIQITSGLIGQPVDSDEVKSIAIDGYKDATPPSQGTVCLIIIMGAMWQFKFNNVADKWQRCDWIAKYISPLVFLFSATSTIISIGIGNKTAMQIESYLDPSMSVAFFGTAFLMYSHEKPNPNDTMMCFAIIFSIASCISFINHPLKDTYATPTGARCLIIIPAIISVMFLINWLRIQYKANFLKFEKLSILPMVDMPHQFIQISSI